MRKFMMRRVALGMLAAGVWAGAAWACYPPPVITNNPPGSVTHPPAPGEGGAVAGEPVNLFSGDEYRHIADLQLWGD